MIPPRPWTVLLTGARGGIGRETALALASQGHRVLALRRQRSIREAETAEDSRNVANGFAEISLPDPGGPGPDPLVPLLAAEKRIDAVALVGGSPPAIKPVFSMPPSEFEAAFASSVVFNIRIIQALVAAHFKPARFGHIVAVGSAAIGPPPAPRMSAYIVAKHALVATLGAVCVEGKGFGLRASVLHPSFVDTAMLNAFDSRMIELIRGKPGRIAKPAAVAERLCDMLLSPPSPGAIVERTLAEPGYRDD